MIAIDIGAGRKKKEDKIDHSAGFVFHKKVGDPVKKDEQLVTLFTNKEESIDNALIKLEEKLLRRLQTPLYL